MKFTLLFFGVKRLKKIKFYSESAYVIALIGLTFAVALLAAADFGVSTIVAPAYIVSLKFSIFTFGEWNYIIQGFLFIAFCIAIKKFRLTYLISFITCVIYGYILDFWRWVVPVLNPRVAEPGSMDLWIRLVMFVLGELLTAFSVMLFFKSYIYPQVCDLFVKGIATKYSLNQTKFKRIFDLACLTTALVLAFIFFKKFVGIGWGTVVIAVVNSFLIGFFSRLYDKYIETVVLIPKFEKIFKL